MPTLTNYISSGTDAIGTYREILDTVYGEGVGTIGEEKNGYITTGSVYLKSEYPALYSVLGDTLVYVGSKIVENSTNEDYGLKGKYIVYNNGTFVMSYDGMGSPTATSTDLQNWTVNQHYHGTTDDLFYYTKSVGLMYANNIYLALYNVSGSSNHSRYSIKTSTDAVTWSTFSYSGFTNWSSLTYGDNGWAAQQGSSQYVYQSTNNFASATGRFFSNTGFIYDMAYGNGIYVGVGQSYESTSSSRAITISGNNASNYTYPSAGELWNRGYTTAFPRCVAYGNGIFLYGGDEGIIGSSTNGVNWIDVNTSGTTNTIITMTYLANRFIYSTEKGEIATSTNGNVWEKISLGISTPVYGITEDDSGSLYFAVHNKGGSVYKITDIDNITELNSDFFNPTSEFYVATPSNRSTYNISGLLDGYSGITNNLYIKAK